MAPGGRFVVANNKGGSGKSTLLFQLACASALARPEAEVLVLDLSLYSDSTTLLMGGTAREGLLAASRGAQRAVEQTERGTRAEGLLRALAEGAAAPSSAAGVSGLLKSFSPFAGASKPAAGGALDLNQYAVAPHAVNPAVPPNVRLVASCGDLPLEEEEWRVAAARLRQALDALPPSTVVFVDTDHLTNAPCTKMALAAADSLVVPVSLDDNDFSRMFIDPTGNALWDVLQGLQDEGLLRARVHKLVFNRVTAMKNASAEQGGIASPFSPPKACFEQMLEITSQLYECYRPSNFQLFQDGAQVATQRQFNERYVTAFRTASETTMNASKLMGSPFRNLRAEKAEVGGHHLDLSKAGLQIETLCQGVQDLMEAIMG